MLRKLAIYILLAALLTGAFAAGWFFGFVRAGVNTKQTIDDFNRLAHRKSGKARHLPEQFCSEEHLRMHAEFAIWKHAKRFSTTSYRGCRDTYHPRRWRYQCPDWPEDYCGVNHCPEPEFYSVLGGDPIRADELWWHKRDKRKEDL